MVLIDFGGDTCLFVRGSKQHMFPDSAIGRLHCKYNVLFDDDVLYPAFNSLRRAFFLPSGNLRTTAAVSLFQLADLHNAPTSLVDIAAHLMQDPIRRNAPA